MIEGQMQISCRTNEEGAKTRNAQKGMLISELGMPYVNIGQVDPAFYTKIWF
jgi:hypothetical protein